MKRLILDYLVIAVIALSAALTSCDKNDDAPATSIVNNNISVTVSDVDAEVENVKLLTDCTIDVDWVWDEENRKIVGTTTSVTGEEIARGVFSGGRLTMNLPETVENRYLKPMYDNMEVPDGVLMSNHNVKGTGGVFLVGYDKDNKETGLFFYGKFDEDAEQIIMAALVYVDNDVIITGSYSNNDDMIKTTVSYDCNLKKGWNFMYVLLSGDGEGRLTGRTTTENPGGLKWVYGKLN